MNIPSKNLLQSISAFDLFPSSANLRYQNQQNIKSITGGFVSIIMVVSLIILFYNSLISMLNRTEFKFDHQIIKQFSPAPTQISSDNFLFVFHLAQFDILSQTENKYFDVEVTKQLHKNGISISSQPISMVYCQRHQFEQYGQEYGKIFDKLSLGSFACLPSNFKMNLQGKWQSEYFQYLRINIKRCQRSDPLCKNDVDLKSYFAEQNSFYANYFFINKLINPSSIQPISTYFEDKNYKMINDKIAVDTNVYLSQYEIITDETFLPFKKTKTEKGVFIDMNEKEEIIRSVRNGSYAQLHFRKSDQKIKIVRKCMKFDGLLSYFGGLLFLITIMFNFVISNYNKCCFEFEMCQKLFKSQNYEKKDSQTEQINFDDVSHQIEPKEQKKIKSVIKHTFNFWTFCKYRMNNFIKKLCPSFHWKSMQMIHQQFGQTQKIMNIDTLLQKISFFERAFKCILDENQILLLFLQNKPSIQDRNYQGLSENIKSPLSTDNNLLGKKVKKSLSNENFKQKESSFIRSNSQILTNQNDLIVLMQFVEKIQFRYDNSKLSEAIRRVYKGIQEISKKSKEGDDVCTKIMKGIRKDIMRKYEEDRDVDEYTQNHDIVGSSQSCHSNAQICNQRNSRIPRN